MNYSQKGIIAKQRALNAKGGKFGRKLGLTLVIAGIIAIIALAVLGISAALGMYNGILASTPQINTGMVASTKQATFVYDNKGNKVDELVAANSNRILVSMDQIPQNMADAIVAREDERFYEHNGVDFMGMLRAGFQFVITLGGEKQGASTITQQLLKNTIFTEWMDEGDNLIKSVKRKLQEQYLAVELSKVLTKEEILERYMNTINLGQNTLGVEAAAQRYFGKSVSDLTLSECATIAVITQNPSKYNPISHPDKNAERRLDCLNKMLELEFITQEEYDEAIADDVYSRIERHNIDFLEEKTTSTYFTDALTYDVREDLIAAGYSETMADNMLYSGGLRIMSTLDPEIQAIVDEEVNNPENYPEYIQYELDCALTIIKPDGSQQNYSKEMMTLYFKENVDHDFDLLFDTPDDATAAFEQYKASLMEEGDDFTERISITPQPQVSVYIMDQRTGYVSAMSGGRGVKEGRFTLNRATDSYRQPGSTFKVLAAYAPALDAGEHTLANVYNDAPFFYDTGVQVSNWYGNDAWDYKGLCSIRYGIEQSLNIVAVKTLTVITPELGFEYLKNFGFKQLADGKEINGKLFYDARQPLALGGITTGVSNEELTAAYAAIANSGVYTEPKLYTVVYDSEGNIILDNRELETHQVIKDTTAFLLTDAMRDVVTQGTGERVNFNKEMAIAGKTGSTTSYKDVWFAGFTPYYTCTTWAGYDNNHDMISKGSRKETNIAKDLWASIMGRIHEDLPAQDFYIPTGIVEAEVCKLSGKLPNPGVCDAHIVTEYFEDSTIPMMTCDVHYVGNICAYDNLIASPSCPFQYAGSWTMTPIEDSSLWNGSTIPIEQPDGSIVYQTPRTSNICQHDVTFFSDPNYPAVLQQQQIELDIRIQEVLQVQQQQAAQQATQGTDPNAVVTP
ncbi:MAG: transglycosylase domain-containing protein [Lachnospiraceae bacterium]|nr:transglycosylase domain-containing protein [Lachnospiraceae bacterium]